MEWTQVFLPIAISFAITVTIMPFFIGYFQMKKHGQQIREEGPKWHNSKAGTPTMGGVVFLIAIVLTSFLTATFVKNIVTTTLFSLLFILVLYGIVGFLDDFIKIFKKRNMGLNSLQKLITQIIGGIIFSVAYAKLGGDHSLTLPVIGELPLGVIIYSIFSIFWMVGFSNAVNLTDGLDGLVAGLGTISFATYALIAWKQSQYDVLVICLAVIGGLLGFFMYNKKPAKIFMGDVGSLALGGLLAGVSIMLHQEWTLLLIGLVYVIETLSVMLQVASFKLTGKRIFKMAPIHHHFEMLGWSEWKVNIVFWIVGLLMSLITLFILY
ncbi:phospho-N-acetylmuramoyl-pentapeptide-transferase [Vagococcus zengguangii]|uniref:Phospho-N-acetylmuramoyl-pentapeptide-transferase n=1 Tax=Vagococcus zengguangii TaxID=2571750 RepID=A0A4D7CWQ6_9ENTE|nr:phospho-N-acetylmuramoyl-pentapeptide-transferase [Vagococcus zengguangii]QCI86761.1 phospho-N-acetylmuramoyl-pentapeptide-transferase [Vagococcus zengguangii]TLG79477.1 phospho-N-acetylmuramoyl-pentapeptide-transferase [Vagococcus zengguangii]